MDSPLYKKKDTGKTATKRKIKSHEDKERTEKPIQHLPVSSGKCCTAFFY